MSIINSTIDKILPLDEISMEKAQKRQNALLKPPNSLGILEKLTVQLSGIYRSENLAMPKKAILIFGSDNEVTALQEQMQNLVAEQTQALRSGKFKEYI